MTSSVPVSRIEDEEAVYREGSVHSQRDRGWNAGRHGGRDGRGAPASSPGGGVHTGTAARSVANPAELLTQDRRTAGAPVSDRRSWP